jgi:tripartite-type tricarboxylate transporter receptor subunit TctC
MVEISGFLIVEEGISNSCGGLMSRNYSSLRLIKGLSTNGKSNILLFALNLSKGKRWIFRQPLRVWLFVSVLAISCVALTTSALAQTPFYQGKTITMVFGFAPGGTGDMRGRAVTAGLKKHIPGSPDIVFDYRQGAGARAAANHVYTRVQPDGLTIGVAGSNLIPAAILGETGVLYDIDKFIYLGTPYSGHAHIFLTRRAAGLRNLENLRAAKGVRVGAQAVGHTIYYTGRMFAYLMGLNEPKFVVGYTGGELDVALRAGEIDARTNHWETPIRQKLFDENLLDVHALTEIPKGTKPHSIYSSVPDLETFARSEIERKLVSLHRAFQAGGSPYVLPPGVPKERVQILREAMRKTFADPEFIAEYKKTGDDSSSLTGEALEKIIKDLPREREVIELFKKLFGPDPLPPR